jgi:predicted TIM-barrel fold metal-dependent hydrolase
MRQQSRLPVWFLKSGIPDLLVKRHGRDFFKLMKFEKISKVAEAQKEQMDKVEDLQRGFKKIDYSVVLLIDYKYVSKKTRGFKYEEIIKETAEACAEHPFSFFPFFCFDPRRPEAPELLKEAYEDYGYVGVKIYPAIGFDPRPYKDETIEIENNNGNIENNLKKLYEFASSKNLPILTHCSPGGSYKCVIDEKKKYRDIWRYTEPSNFLEIARDYGLRICFAHMGGKIDHKVQKEMATQWHNQILNLIKLADSWDSEGRIYADQSYGISHVINKKKRLIEHANRTREYLEDNVLGRYIIFGTDWPLGLYKFTENTYINTYRENNRLIQVQQEKYFSDNIARFLFGESKQIPENYIDFITKQNGGETPKVEDWVRKENGKYFLV